MTMTKRNKPRKWFPMPWLTLVTKDELLASVEDLCTGNAVFL